MTNVFASVALILLSTTASTDTLIFEEPFDQHLAEGWTWLRENPDNWRVADGALEIRIEPGNMWGRSNDARNVLVRDIPSEAGDCPVAITARVQNEPTGQYEQVDLVWYYDDSNMVKIGMELVHGQRSIVMGREEKDATMTLSIIPMAASIVDLRLTVCDGKIHGEYRVAGEAHWNEGGKCALPVKGLPKLSIQAYQGEAETEHWAHISNLRIYTPAE